MVAVEVARRLAAGHALPIMSSVLLRHQAVPELVPVVEVSMITFGIRPEVPLLRDGETATSKAADGARPIAYIHINHPPALVGRLAVAADPARE